MEMYIVGKYIVGVETEGKKPGDAINVMVRSKRANAKYQYIYRLVWFIDDQPADLAQRACGHHMMGGLRAEKLPIGRR